MKIERLPEPLQTQVRRLVLQLKIPVNRLLAVYNRWSRKWYQFKLRDPTPWAVVDLGHSEGTRTRRFCISLLDEPRFEPRRRLFLRYARKFGWQVDFWPAVNGKRFQTEGYPEWLTTGRKADNDEPFGAGAIGLLATTKEIYEWAWEQKLDYLVIFEDDGIIHSPPRIELPTSFDFVFLNNRVQGDKKGLLIHGWGTDGYIISRRGIQKMLQIFQHVTADIDMLIMMYTKSLEEYEYYVTRHRDKSKPQLESYHVGPLVTHAGFFDSSVGLMSSDSREIVLRQC